MSLVPFFKLYWRFVKLYDDYRLKYQSLMPGIDVWADIPYSTDGHEAHKFDIYYPSGCKEKLPVIIDIHGGGWMYGKKELNAKYCMHLALEGYAVIPINYRLAPEVTVQEQLQDILEFFNFFSNNISHFPCDSDRVFLTGDSAGGQLAAYSAILNTDETLCKIADTKPSGLRIKALALISAVCFMEESGLVGKMSRAALGKGYEETVFGKYVSLDNIINFGAIPPTFFVTSTGDGFGLEQTMRAYELFKEKNSDCELLDWPKTNGLDLLHVFSVLNPDAPESIITIKKMLEFFNKHS